MFLWDERVRLLRAEAPDEGEAAIRTLAYLSLVLTSWQDGKRQTIRAAFSPSVATDERVDALRDVGLIDVEGRIPETTWSSWFQPAVDRREHRRTAGSKGGRKTRERRLENGASTNGTGPATSPARTRQTDRQTT